MLRQGCASQAGGLCGSLRRHKYFISMLCMQAFRSSFKCISEQILYMKRLCKAALLLLSSWTEGKVVAGPRRKIEGRIGSFPSPMCDRRQRLHWALAEAKRAVGYPNWGITEAAKRAHGGAVENSAWSCQCRVGCKKTCCTAIDHLILTLFCPNLHTKGLSCLAQ